MCRRYVTQYGVPAFVRVCACVQALRLYPAVPMMSRKNVCPVDLLGHTIPADVSV